MTLPDVPATKICTDPGIDFGAVAVELPEDSLMRMQGEWAVMTLNRGGDYRTDEQVANWTDLVPTSPE